MGQNKGVDGLMNCHYSTKIGTALDKIKIRCYNYLVSKAELPVLTVRLGLNGQYC